MKSLFRALVLGGLLLATVAPGAAVAQDYTPSIRPSAFEPLDPADPTVVTHTVSGTSINGLGLPFPVVYYGAVFNQINVSTFGYVTFSSRPGVDEAPGGRSDPGVAANQFPLPSATRPNGLIAAWWDDLRCPAGAIKTRDAYIQGSRTFTIEWNGCYKEPDTNATVQMQVRFTEESPIIRVFYGSAGPGSAHDATVGIENPARWTEHDDGTWTLDAPGGSVAVMPTLSPACTGAGCGRASWPAQSMIKYGRPTAPDLQAGPNPVTGRLGVEITSLSGIGTITVELDNNIENDGYATANGVTWQYYVSTDDHLDPEVDTLLPTCGNSTGVTIAGTTVATYHDTCTVTLDPGIYRICSLVDPPTETAPEGVVVEANETNNSYCSREFVVGADVLGSITVPAGGQAGGNISVPIRVQNRGSDTTPPFLAQIWLQDCATSDTTGNVLAWETTLTLPGGDEWTDVATVPVRPDAQGTSICAVLVLDPDDVVPELNEFNNEYSTCVANGDLPRSCVAITRPNLLINEITTDLPIGCYFGEPVGLAANICNDQPVEARSFGLAFYIDENPIVTINDTMVLSIPQSCTVSADCIDLGGGQPTCVAGICQAPCLVDADCGPGGLECEPSYVVPGNTCQLVLPPESCKWVRTTANIPTFDIFENAEFVDGPIYFGAIIDWTDKVGETAEGNENKKASQNPTHCWTRKPDFEPLSVETLPEIASGEVVPVQWRVRNIGTVGSPFSYRYVLSSNDTISTHDLALHIEGVGPVGDAVAEARTDNLGTDLVRIPAGMVPGTYYLGIVVDPDDQILELLEDNNTARSAPVEVVRATLRIVTPSLPPATVGASYTVRFQALGGEEYRWSVSDGMLPPGLQLTEDGLLHGTVLEQGTYLFRITVTAGANSASTPFVIEAVPAAGPLALTLAELPPAFVHVEYRVLLGASGGVPPYTWACTGLPGWLNLQNGYLIGTPPATANAVPFTCTVTDALKTTTAKEYAVAVYPAEAVRIRTQEVPGVDVGHELSASCVFAEGGSGQYDWSFDPSTAPPGVGFEDREGAGCFFGVPTACGTYLVEVTVADRVQGLSDTQRLPLPVYCDSIRLVTRTLPAAERNTAYEAQLVANADTAVVFELAQGALPPGLTLAADGKISGVVAIDARSGAHHAAIRLRDQDGSTGMGAIAIEVLGDPAPGVKETHTKTITGCSTSGEGAAAGLLPFTALFALLGLRRRARLGTAARSLGVALLALLLPATAAAQITPGYATYHFPKPYEPLPESSRILDPQNQNSAFIINLNGWTVPFYGENYGTFLAHENGLIIFGTMVAASTPYRIPYTGSTTSPRNFIAGWWDDHNMNDRPGDWRWMVRGPEGNREVVFQWRWVTSTASDLDDGGEHQIAIFEDGTIAIRWGEIIDSGTYTSSHRAVIGLMDAMGSKRSVPFLECSVYTTSSTASCSSEDWNRYLRNTEAIFTTLPNLQVRSTRTDYEGLAGLDQTFIAEVYNYGPFPASGRVRFYASADTTVSDDDLVIGTTEPHEIGPFAVNAVELTTVLPRDLAETRHFLLAEVDPDDELREFVEDDNQGGAYEFRVAEAMPDLAALRVNAPASGAPGSTITVDLELLNNGNLDAADVPFVLVLSENEAITSSDLVIYEGTFGVGWRQTAERSFVATLPLSMAPGTYYLGVVIDPEGTVPELDKLNNVARAERPFHVVVDGLAALTGGSWTIEIGSEFCMPLEAVGGDGSFVWSLVEGQLPPGIELYEEGLQTVICGRPTKVGLFDFTLEVASAGRTARTQMSIEVRRESFNLQISGAELPVARFQTPYEAGLIAFGGTVPYTWDLSSGVLPVGLSFQKDGLLFGTPLEAGTFTFQARVTDAANRTAIRTITLVVTQPPRVTCSSRTLGTLALGEPFTGKLLAAGGSSNRYDWTTVRTRRFDAGAAPIDEEQPPPGLILGVTGDISGAPSEVGRYLWTVEVRVTGTVETDTCALTVDVVGGQGLTITTVSLPNAVPDREYRAQLQVAGASGNVTWSLPVGSYLPEGLFLDTAQGVIYGTPTSAALGDAPSRTYGFLVEVRDSQNLHGQGAFSITLAPERKGEITVVERTKDEGCQAAGGGFSLAALALVAVALRRRR